MPTPRDKHETKPEQDSGFKGDYKASTRAHPKWRVGDAERTPLPVQDYSPQIDLTGRWIDEEGGFYLFINHVRGHVEVLLACVESGSSGIYNDEPRDKKRSDERLIRMGGEQRADDDPTIELYLRLPGTPLDDTSYICGTLTGSDESILLQLDGNVSQARLDAKLRAKLQGRLNRYAKRIAKRLNREPCLFPHHLCVSGVAPEERSEYWFPATPIQQHKLSRFILDARIRVTTNYRAHEHQDDLGHSYVKLVRDYFELLAGTLEEGLDENKAKSYRSNLLVSLDALVFRAFNASLQLPAEQGGIDSFGQPDWSQASLEALYKTKVQIPSLPPGERSLVELTQMMLDGTANHNLKNFAKYLYMGPTSGGHYYGAYIMIGELNALKKVFSRLGKMARQVLKELSKLPVGTAVMSIQVRKEEDPDLVPEPERADPEWTANYYVLLYGLALSKSVKAGTDSLIMFNARARNVYGQPWLPEQLVGRARFQTIGASVRFGPWGFGRSVSLVTMFGSGKSRPPTPLHLVLDTKADKSFYIGASASAAAKRFGGRARLVDGINNYKPEEIEQPEYELEYSGHSETAPLHFPINGALPMGHAERMLEVLAANELVALSSEHCEIELHGYADQPGTKIKNLILSRNRAISVYNYLKSVCYARMQLGELPELPPEAQEIKDNKKSGDEDLQIEDPSIPGVTIIANGEPPSSSKKQEDYESQLRRVDIIVNQAVTLKLRRMQDD